MRIPKKTPISTTPKKVIVLCKDYNGHKNVLFMMKEDDFRLKDDYRLKDNWSVVTQGTHNFKEKVFVGTNGKKYKTFSDWSVKEM